MNLNNLKCATRVCLLSAFIFMTMGCCHEPDEQLIFLVKYKYDPMTDNIRCFSGINTFVRIYQPIPLHQNYYLIQGCCVCFTPESNESILSLTISDSLAGNLPDNWEKHWTDYVIAADTLYSELYTCYAYPCGTGLMEKGWNNAPFNKRSAAGRRYCDDCCPDFDTEIDYDKLNSMIDDGTVFKYFKPL